MPRQNPADLQDIFLLESGAKGRPEVRFSFVAWVLFKFSLSPADLFVVQTEHQHDSVKETHAAMTAYQQYLIKEGERQEEIDALRVDAEKGGLAGGRAMIRLNLLENTGKEERGKSEVMLKKAQRAASRYLKSNNPFEQEKAAHDAAGYSRLLYNPVPWSGNGAQSRERKLRRACGTTREGKVQR